MAKATKRRMDLFYLRVKSYKSMMKKGMTSRNGLYVKGAMRQQGHILVDQEVERHRLSRARLYPC